MKKSTRITGLLAVLLLALAGTAIAFHGDATPITWLTGGDTMVLMQGQTSVWKARFCVETHQEIYIKDASWTATESLSQLFGSGPHFLGDLRDGPIYTIQQNITVPETLKRGLYSGNIAIIGTRVPLEPSPRNTDSKRQVIPHTLQLQIHVVDSQ